jgi:Rha family phage regulatory protein
MTNAIQAIVTIQNDQLTTTSKNIADVFGKLHKDVLRAIENILPELPEDHKRNFALMLIDVEIGSGATRQDKAYQVTRDGFTLLAMGFTGKKALEFKLAYIDQFNAMQKALTVPQIERLTLTPEQQRFVQKAVNAKVKKTGEHWNTIYHNIKDVFNVGTYTDIKQETFPALCEYLGVVYTGEFIAATEAPRATPSNKVLVDKEYLEGLTQMVKMIDERFALVEKAESDIQHAFNLLSVITSGHMKQANDSIREARYRMIDAIKHANSYTNMMMRTA